MQVIFKPIMMSKLQARNEAVIDAPIATIWSVITDITVLHRINPGVVRATGAMDQLQRLEPARSITKGGKAPQQNGWWNWSPKRERSGQWKLTLWE